MDNILSKNEQLRTCSSGFKLAKTRFKKEGARNWFINKVVGGSKRFSSQVISMDTIESFKNFDRFM